MTIEQIINATRCTCNYNISVYQGIWTEEPWKNISVRTQFVGLWKFNYVFLTCPVSGGRSKLRTSLSLSVDEIERGFNY